MMLIIGKINLNSKRSISKISKKCFEQQKRIFREKGFKMQVEKKIEPKMKPE